MSYLSVPHPVPLNPGRDVTMDAKLNQLCEKCSSIADHVALFRKSCSIDSNNPTVHWINHHASSNALVTSARAGCHLCTLLLAEIKMPMGEDGQARELGIMDKQIFYQIMLSGSLQQTRPRRKREMLRIAMKPFSRPNFEWSGFKRHVFICLVPQIPDGGTEHQVAGDALSWPYNREWLSISHLTGKSMIYCYRFFC